jgi:hypothetical protein
MEYSKVETPIPVKINSCSCLEYLLWLKICRESKIEKKHKTYSFEILLQEIEYVLKF